MSAQAAFNFTPARASLEAADSIADSKQVLYRKILGYLASCRDGATCDECEVALEMAHQTASARYSELARDGRIVPIGKRKTRSGRFAVVYQAAEAKA